MGGLKVVLKPELEGIHFCVGGLKVVLNPELDEFCFCVWLLGRVGGGVTTELKSGLCLAIFVE